MASRVRKTKIGTTLLGTPGPCAGESFLLRTMEKNDLTRSIRLKAALAALAFSAIATVAPAAYAQAQGEQGKPATAPTTAAAAPAAPPSQRWEPQIAAFEESDRKMPPPPGSVLFIGSSSIVNWKSVTRDFPGVVTLRRGFGGSQITDSVYYADRIVVPYKPRAIVFYAGDNDISAGKSAETVLQDFKAFVGKVRAGGLADTTVFFLAVKPSPSRWKLWPTMRRANELVQEWAKTQPGGKVVFVDVATPLLAPDGQPRPEFYLKDRLHLSAEGYRVWTRTLAPYLAPYAEAAASAAPSATPG